MREIGGYFGLDAFGGKEYHADLLALNTARNALVYLLRAKRIRKIYIPYFLCDSVSKVCAREGAAFSYYRIGKDFLPLFDTPLSDGEYLYIVNYYGRLTEETVLALQKKYGNIILDNVQAFFEKPLPGIDTLYSCRKFFGVPDGAYLATDARLDEPLMQDVSMERMRHVLGRCDGTTASDFYADFKANDASFVGVELRSMSKLTHTLLGTIPYEAVRRRREENFALLAAELDANNPIAFPCPVGPYAYPFYCENGMAVKKKLAEKKIFVATLWPNVLERNGTVEKDYAENILPLPCDQRYDSGDMERMILEVEQCINSENWSAEI